jgi:hypothetical protein
MRANIGTMSMSIEPAEVMGFLSTIVSVGVGAWVGLARITIANREKEIDRRLDDCRAESKAMNDRLHVEEKATIQQNGEIARLRDQSDRIHADIADMKKHMVTKGDWMHTDRAVDDLRRQIGVAPRHQTPGVPAFRAQRGVEESSDPPAKNTR